MVGTADLPADWPHRELSRFVTAGGVRWHLQVFGPPLGQAPCLLLLHGTGASTHSWRDLAPLLARDHTVLAPDLPGHAYSSRPRPDAALGLQGMAASLGALLATLGVSPQGLLGHSAGAAIAAQMCLDGLAQPGVLFSVNGAWLPPGGPAGRLYLPLARLLVLNPLVPRWFAWQASQGRVVQRLVDATGSRIDAAGVALYARLVADPGHVAAVLAMMAQWRLEPLFERLPGLAPVLHLLAAERDPTVPPSVARQVAQRLPAARLHPLPGLGHLAHEEAPATVARLLRRLLRAS